MKFSFVHRYLSNLRLILFAYLLLVVAGVFALINIPRELMPSVNFPIVIVSVVLPGASPNDIEDLITIPLEDRLSSINGLKTLSSSSMENTGLVIAQFEDNLPVEDYVREVQQIVSETNLPNDALKPNINKINFDESPIWTFSLQGNDRIGLNLIAEKIEKELKKQSIIDRVEISGLNEREIVVLADPNKLTNLSIRPPFLAQIITAATGNIPAGNLNVETLNYNVGIDKTVTDVASLRQMPIILNGELFRLGEITEIYEQEKPGNASAFQLDQNGAIGEVITFNVYKIAGAPIDRAAKVAREVTEKIVADYPQFFLRDLLDYGQEISKTFMDLGKNMIVTIALVFVVMLIFLGIREATISAFSIPIVMLLTFAGMTFFDLSLNFISLFSLLLVLGMLVDNAIVVTTALSRAYGRGKQSALEAGVQVWREFFMALVATNLTTVWAFLPLILMTGMMGQFLEPISIVVTIAILGSALVAFLLTLPLGIFVLNFHLPTRVQKLIFGLIILLMTIVFVVLSPKNIGLLISLPIFLLLLYLALFVGQRIIKNARKWTKNTKHHWYKNFLTGFVSTEKLEYHYRLVLDQILTSHRYSRKLLIAIIMVTVFSFSLPVLGFVKGEFFPKDNADIFEFELSLPIGTNQETAQSVAKEVLPQLQSLPEVDYITAQTGRGNSAQLVSGSSNNHKILFTFNLKPKKERKYSSTELAQMIRDQWQNNTYGEAVVIEASSGPPAGSDLQLSIAGAEMSVLETYANKLIVWLETQEGVKDISSSVTQASKRLVFVGDEHVLATYGLTSSDLALWLRSNLSGWSLGNLNIEGKEIEIMFRQQQGIPTISELQKITVPVAGVGNLPLASLGQFELRPNIAQISREDSKRLITVSASVEAGFSATEIGKRLNQYAANDLELPEGYNTIVGGVNEQNAESMAGIQLAMLVAAFLILATLVIQLRSFRKAFIVMSVIPVAISGVFINFALFGLSLSLPATIGILALFGIVVNNSILIVERINQNLSAGKKFQSAVVTGSSSRLQPILLTSLTTIVGLLPITFSDPMWQGLGGAIIAGLAFSGSLLLFYIPALYYIMFEPNKLEKKEENWRKFWRHFQS